VQEVRSGIYRHHKGPLYQVLGLAHDANADELYFAGRNQDPRNEAYGPAYAPYGERAVVVYFALELNPEHLGPRLAVRTVEDFTADVDGRPRFEYLGHELTREMTDGRG
jgi:hypothetical protein